MTYEGWVVEFEDRLLAHLQVVVVQRLRNRESFTMSWLDAIDAGDGRSSIWLHPEGNLYFRFFGSRMPSINPDWIDALNTSARSSRGLIVQEEDGRLARSLSLKQVGPKR